MKYVRKCSGFRTPLRSFLRFCSNKGSSSGSKKSADLKASSICKGQAGDSVKKGEDDKKSTKSHDDGCKDSQLVTMIRGDGVGTELMEAVKKVCAVSKVPIEWDYVEEYKVPGSDKLNPDLLASLKRTKVGVKGPMAAQYMRKLYKQFGLYAHVAVCRSLEGVKLNYGRLDCVVIREVMEGEYSGIEHSVVPGILQSIKVSTSAGGARLARYVFEFALANNRKKITAAHKANIMRMTDGSFLKSMQAEARNHTGKVQLEERYMDTTCLNLIMDPEQNDVIVSSSMYGDVLVVIAASILGSKPLCPGFCVSENGMVFDAMIERSRDLAGSDVVNPTGILLSTSMMLKHLKYEKESDALRCAIEQIYRDTDIRTSDLGGTSKTSEFVNAVCENLSKALAS